MECYIQAPNKTGRFSLTKLDLNKEMAGLKLMNPKHARSK